MKRAKVMKRKVGEKRKSVHSQDGCMEICAGSEGKVAKSTEAWSRVVERRNGGKARGDLRRDRPEGMEGARG